MDGGTGLLDGVVEALGRGATVVTGNQRAARSLRREIDRRNRGLGLGSWGAPAILAWDAWTAGLWRGLLMEGNASQALLNPAQEHAVWRAVLEADEELASLRTVDSLAEMAAEAWRGVWQYGGQGWLRRGGGSSDTRAFQRWAQVFERTCRAEGFLTQAQLELTLGAAVQAGWVGLGGVVLVGFDAFWPARRTFLDAWRAAGGGVEELRGAVPVERRVLAVAADEAEERASAARWVRGVLEERPEARVAVIVPGLEGQRAEIDRVFREVLAPELEDIEARCAGGPYEFSLGVPLARTGLVGAALDLLRWAVGPLPTGRVSSLMLSPYFCMRRDRVGRGNRGEPGARAEFDAFELRRARMLRPEVSLEWLSAMVDGSRRRARLGRLPEALRAMRRVVAARLRGGDRRSHAEWAERMRELLEAAAWGAGEGEDSVEFQTRRRWESALDELATLDFDAQRVEFEQALGAVERIAQRAIFAPESRGAPVQVMGPLEAAGGSFDAVWFLRGGDLSWPVGVGSDPLLSWQMQSELGMPGVDVARDTEAARRVTERIAESAGRVVFSYARETAEGRQRPSAVLAGLGLEEVEAADWVGLRVEREQVEMEEVEDAARVRALPDQVIHGGARILELQAACGFRAFAEQRLWATEPEAAGLGMDARESGTAVHRVLEFFWSEVKTQDALRAMTLAERAELLDGCIGRALEKSARLNGTVWDAAYLNMQRERLRRLVGGWLELELERAPFEVKGQEEEFGEVRVGPLRLSVRMDRVDVVEGGEVLIDYKTGMASPGDWLTERPNAPQLPLYAILSDPKLLQGVAFGLVRAGEGRELKGYAASEGVLPKVTRMKFPSLEAQVEDWRRVLERLAEEFASGEARVAPNRYPATCERCAQRILCRLDVSLLDDANDEGDDDAEVGRG